MSSIGEPVIDQAWSLRWRKSTYSQDDGACVEAASAASVVAIRDSKILAGPAIGFSGSVWAAFLDHLK
ncbi:DUF397 domain-containing protein [Embleya sp. NPDC020630]|uniref:DUF397 domain-containing protein n=1 Tax=Embleya sp. NPDC020630 TaxID=3363979 RepID=UPI003791B5E2